MRDRTSLGGHLYEIGTSLWDRGGAPGSGRAAIMVGAGFSRNAQRMASVAGKFPDWEDVARALVDRLYRPCEKGLCETREPHTENCEICDRRKRQLAAARETSGALRLAEIYESIHGRAALERVLAAAIPSSQYYPGLAHQKLVRLPWSDIFTTNWDDLLEKAVDLYDRSYTVIHVPKHIATRRPPRIVKLHGSLSAGTPLIFTENDFLNYPANFAPFVSLVQQSMMENVFVLVGFSGEDPNFLHWMSWVRRHLGNFVQQIYLVGVKDVEETERQLLAARGVIPLNISSLSSKQGTNDHERALIGFFDCLQRIRTIVRCNIRWPERTEAFGNTSVMSPRAWKLETVRHKLEEVRGKLKYLEYKLGDVNRRLDNTSPEERTSIEKNRASLQLEFDTATDEERDLISRLFLEEARHKLGDWEDRLNEMPQWLTLPHKNRWNAIQYTHAGTDLDHIKVELIVNRPDIAIKQLDDAKQREELLADRVRAVNIISTFWEAARCPVDDNLANGYLGFVLDLLGNVGRPANVEGVRSLLSGRTNAEKQAHCQHLFEKFPLPKTRAAYAALFAVLRYARHNAKGELFNAVSDVLELCAPQDHGVASVLYYERALRHLGRSELAAAKGAIDVLMKLDFTPRWGLRRAGLLAELGRKDEALEALEKTVEKVRRLYFEPDKPSSVMWQQSREAWSFFVSHDLRRNAISDRTRTDTVNPQLPPSEILDELEERLSELVGNTNDPRSELAQITSDLMRVSYQMALREGQPNDQEPNRTTTLDGDRDVSFSYLLLAEAVGLRAQLAVANDEQTRTPVNVRVAAILWDTCWRLALSLLLRSAAPHQMDWGPLSIKSRIDRMEDDKINDLLRDLIERGDRIIATLAAERSMVDYADGRLATLFAVMHLAVSSHSGGARLAFDALCRWHGSADLALADEALQTLQFLFEGLVKLPSFPWADKLEALFELNRPMRAGEVWGKRNWPDPFSSLVDTPQKSAGGGFEFALSDKGREIVKQNAGTIARIGVNVTGSLEETEREILRTGEPWEVLPIRRRLYLIEEANKLEPSVN